MYKYTFLNINTFLVTVSDAFLFLNYKYQFLTFFLKTLCLDNEKSFRESSDAQNNVYYTALQHT